MNFFLKFVLSVVHFAVFTQQQSTVYYPGYGTFTNSSPFSDPLYRPIANLPQNPSIINTKFYLYTRQSSTNGTLITSASQSNFFVPNKKIVFIVHGWTQNAYYSWIIEMKNTLLFKENTNVVAVDWRGGSVAVYEQAVANTQIVGIDISSLIDAYVKKRLITPNGVHIIGHSLGAHVAGFAGSHSNSTIGHITGLDPAGPEFEGMSTLVRLDKTDAAFVDIIHSDAEIVYPFKFGAGMQTPSGHVDFWPNGGRNQPG